MTLLKAQKYGSSPVTTRYSVFTGAFGMIVAAVGAVGIFFEALPALVPMALDAVAGILLAAGGIAWAIGLKGISCKLEDSDKMLKNALLNGGCVKAKDGSQFCGVADGAKDVMDVANNLKATCQKAFVGEIFQFLAFALAAILIALGWFIRRRGGSSKPRFVT